ncbi:type VI secretion system tip protein VgrG [Nitrogeniibacter mangrovi]|uniref:Type VI secretion system tip protein VgrG n=1 Tax=Nitrogeniibacter mangrovi TaxID=2016596 RepID=A0A6C1B1L3_9RHOO|nr:type VI secretion system Vgr family protein [Nitrogeniibacter mangrovi]QID17457.1 type VI secretion system tip protein VgrG [Nitrogeniibacter mangrovi]
MNFLPLGASWTQTDRLLVFHTPLGADLMLAECVCIREGVGPAREHAGFRIELSALCPRADIAPQQLIGQPVRLDLQTSGSRTERRPFHGHVTRFERTGANGGFARYRLVIEPWLAFLGHRKDSFVFQDKTVFDIVDEVLGDWQGQGALVPAWRWEVADRSIYPQRSYTVQFEETDLAFLRRLLADEGLFCWFEHRADDSSALGAHTLVIADHNGAFVDNPQAHIRFTQPGATLAEDSIDRWAGARQLGVSESVAGAWDYRAALRQRQGASSRIDNAETPIPLTATDDAGQYAWQNSAQGERRLRNRQQAIDAAAKCFDAEGTVRTLAPGTLFRLGEHPDHDLDDDPDQRFVVVAVTHHARNNLAEHIPQAIEALGAVDGDGSAPVDLYRNHFTTLRAHVPWRIPAHNAAGRFVFPRPRARLLGAVVVGPGEPTHTDRDLRVKVQFPFQRGGCAANRNAHPAGGNNAPADDTLGVWLRMATPVAGANWGGHCVPRPGQEVSVGFLHGDIDRPVILGASYNGRGNSDAAGNRQAQGDMLTSANAPAFFAGESAEPHTHGASLSGIKTQQLSASRSGAGGFNQLVFDDTPGQSRIELGTTEYASALQMGHLKCQDDNARHQSLGHGASVHTRASAAVRAGSGLLISADARSGARGPHLDSTEPIAQTQEAQTLATALADVAGKQNAALDGDAPARALSANAALQSAVEVMGATATRAGSASSAGEFVAAQGGTGTVPAWSRPRIQYAAPKGIAQLTPANAVLVSGKSASFTTGHAGNWVAQANHSLATRDGIALFTVGRHEGGGPNTETGIHLHAASGKVSTQAQSGPIRAAADKTVTVASTTASVNASAKGHILATAQGAYLKIEGGNIQLHAPGAVRLKASQKNLTGPASASPAGLSFPKGGDPAIADCARQVFDEKFCVKHEATGEPLRYFNYRIEDDSGQVLARGMTDEAGMTSRVVGSNAQDLKIIADDD